MSKVKLIILTMMIVFGASSVQAAGYAAQNVGIGAVGVKDNISYVRRASGTWGNPDGCASSTLVFFESKQILASALTAKASGTNVDVYVDGCQPWAGTSYPIAVTISVR
jgi:hypothetical protein